MTKVWDDYWRGRSVSDTLGRVDREERSLRFRRIEAELVRRLGSLTGLRAVELGAGAGTTSIALARRGAEVTLVDNVPAALELATKVVHEARVEAEIIAADLFDPPAERAGAYDVALSFGVAEHFRGAERVDVVAAHLRWIRSGGLVVLSVPNALCPTYRLWKWWLERHGEWPFGFEAPFSPWELRGVVNSAGGRECVVVGSSAAGDLLRFATPVVAARIAGRPLKLPEFELPTPLDAALGYALTAIFLRNSDGWRRA